MYPLGTWFVSGICVWIPCIKETDDDDDDYDYDDDDTDIAGKSVTFV